MFTNKIKRTIEIDEEKLKNLKLFERVDADYLDNNGLSVYYIRVVGGLIRCLSNTEAISQQFIALPASYFHR